MADPASGVRPAISPWRLALREIQHGKGNFLLCLATATAAVGIFVALLTMSQAAARTTAILLRDMGFNLLIVPQGTDMNRYWTLDFPATEMPEAYVQRLAASDVLADHFVAKLQKTLVFGGRTVILTGVLPEVGRLPQRRKTPLPTSYDIPPGRVYLGHELGKGATKGEKIRLQEREFLVDRVLAEKGTLDDIRIYAHLRDVQEMLGKKHLINAIDALGCRCSAKTDFLQKIEKQIKGVLPEVQVKHYRSIAVAREETRRMFDRYATYGFVVVLVLGAWAIAGFTYSNVRQRRHEFGILRALGVGTGKIGMLLLLKVLIYSLLGVVLGFVAGTAAAHALGPSTVLTEVRTAYHLLYASLVVAPALALLFGALPIIYGLTLDPAVVLREE